MRMSIISFYDEAAKRTPGSDYSMEFQLIDGSSGILDRYSKFLRYEYRIDGKSYGEIPSLPAMILALRYLMRDRFPVAPLRLEDTLTVHLSSAFPDETMRVTYGNSALLCVMSQDSFNFAVDIQDGKRISEAFFSCFMIMYDHRELLYTLLKKYYEQEASYDECFHISVREWLHLLTIAQKYLNDDMISCDILGTHIFSYLRALPIHATHEGPLFL